MAGETTQQAYSLTNIPLYLPRGKELACVRRSYSITSGELETNDLNDLLRFPVGALIVDGYIALSDVDTNGSPAILVTLGITGVDDDGYVTSSNIGQAGGVARFNGVLLRDGTAFTSETVVTLKVATAAATGASGTLTVCITYVNGLDMA